MIVKKFSLFFERRLIMDFEEHPQVPEEFPQTSNEEPQQAVCEEPQETPCEASQETPFEESEETPEDIEQN
jgi:hypothetical protein